MKRVGAAVVVCVLVMTGAPWVAAAPPAYVTNTGLARGPEKPGGGQGGPPPMPAGSVTPFGSGLVAVEVAESNQGGTDLNGDGDALDEIVQVHTAGGVANTGLSLFRGFEIFGADLAMSSGSGLYVLDGVTGVATLIHPTGFDPVTIGGQLAFRVGEEVAGADLNGDGDLTDNVAHFYDPATGTVTNSMRDAGFSGPAAVAGLGTPAAINQSDFSVFIYDPATNSSTDTLLDGSALATAHTQVAVVVSEIAAGADLNGDGDAIDPVPHVYDVAADTRANLRLASGQVVGLDGFLALGVIEAAQGGTDLNGDGDAGDTVLHLYEAFTGTVTNTRRAGSVDLQADGRSAFVNGHVAIVVAEAEQGGADLNGDGDATDVVIQLYDVATQAVANTGLSQSGRTVLAGGRVAITVREADQGGSDLNGDGDAADDVLHLFDPLAGTATNTGLGVDAVFATGTELGAFVSESQQGADLNGDGDLGDSVVHFVNPPTGAAVNTMLAGAVLGVFGAGGSMVSAAGVAAFAVSEAGQGGTDLNGDGDVADDVVHRASTFRERQVGLVDPSQGRWHLRTNSGQVITFFYGDPGDVPFVGDWDCDGDETPGLYRRSDGFVYLRNSNTTGIADIRFFFGNPGDVPLAGDFDGDGCDTVSLYRPSEERFFIINELGADDGGLGAADVDYRFGDPGDKPFVGDFDGDGIETVGLHRESTGLVYFRNTHTTGIADASFVFGDPGDRLVAHDFGPPDGVMTPALFRPGDTTVYFRWTNTAGVADDAARFGQSGWLPVAGDFGLG